MSAFHNSKSGEQLALAWHRFGTFVSAVMAVLSLMAALWNLALAAIALLAGQVIVAAVYGVIALGYTLCAFISAAGVVWHRNATKDHLEHLDGLERGDHPADVSHPSPKIAAKGWGNPAGEGSPDFAPPLGFCGYCAMGVRRESDGHHIIRSIHSLGLYGIRCCDEVQA